MMTFVPYEYQRRAMQMIVDRPRCGLFIEMGLGKTVCALSAYLELQSRLEVGTALVIAPKSVALNTWTDECSKWSHLSELRTSVVMGDEPHRLKALESDADIYIINRDNVVWLAGILEFDLSSRFDMVIVDESSSFKSEKSQRFKALARSSANVQRMVLMTGTPAPNGEEDLWSQIYLLDRGARLGTSKTGYMHTYFRPGYGSGNIVYKWFLNPGSTERISSVISDICLSMRASDYIDLPDMIVIRQKVQLSGRCMEDYRHFQRDMVMQVPDGDTIVATTAVAMCGKLQQFVSGAVYDDQHMVHATGTDKMDALVDLVESAAGSGENVLVYYQYRHELPRIMEALAAYAPVPFAGEPATLGRWNKGGIRVLLAQPASVSYGLNLQQGGHVIVWYSLTYDLEQYSQANARLHRQGQGCPVRVYQLLAEGTVDLRISEALESKDGAQQVLLGYIDSIRQQLKSQENEN